MKKILAILLAAVLLAGIVPAMAEGPVAGGWSLNEFASEIPEDAQAALTKALESHVGVNVTPVALLGTQVVAGTNYSFLCRLEAVVAEPIPYYAVVCVYADLEGNASISGISEIDLSAAPAEEPAESQAEAEEPVRDISADITSVSEDGTVLTVTLDANATTGYAWTWVTSDEDPVTLVSEEYKADAAEGLVGVGGKYTASFKAASEGTAILFFSYARTGAEEEPASIVCVIAEVSAEGTFSVLEAGIYETETPEA